jgi:hypothetical protein
MSAAAVEEATQRTGLVKTTVLLSSLAEDLRGDHWSGVHPNEEGSTDSQSLLFLKEKKLVRKLLFFKS